MTASERMAPRPAAAQMTSPTPKMSGVLMSTPEAPIRTMHNGGPIAKDGIYNLKKGEHVLTQDEVAKVHKHALMAAGLKSMAKAYKAGDSQKAMPAKPVMKSASAKGLPVKIDAAHKKPEKKETADIKLRPEKNQAAQVKQQMAR